MRKVLESLGLKVNRLIRVAFGPFELGELDDGAVEEVETDGAAQDTRARDRRRRPNADFECAAGRDETLAVTFARGRDRRQAGAMRRDASTPRQGRRRKRRALAATNTEAAAATARGGPRPTRPRPK